MISESHFAISVLTDAPRERVVAMSGMDHNPSRSWRVSVDGLRAPSICRKAVERLRSSATDLRALREEARQDFWPAEHPHVATR